MYYSFYVLLDLICQNVVKDFYICVHEGYCSPGFLYYHCLVVIGGQCCPHRTYQEVFLSIFWENLCRTGVFSSKYLDMEPSFWESF